MKGFLENGDDGRLHLRLHAEGRNDMTLLQMLLSQYPAVIREGHDQVEIPIAEPYLQTKPDLDDAVIEIPANIGRYGLDKDERCTLSAKSTETITGAQIDTSDCSDVCVVKEVRINGRLEKRNTFDLYPGYLVEIELRSTLKIDRGFVVRIKKSS
jgi:hypothetical protein